MGRLATDVVRGDCDRRSAIGAREMGVDPRFIGGEDFAIRIADVDVSLACGDELSRRGDIGKPTDTFVASTLHGLMTPLVLGIDVA